MDRNLALEFVRVTEAAAIAAAKWIGRGDKMKADGAAVDEMRDRFNQIDFAGRIVIGEGAKDEAPELYTGEYVGAAISRSRNKADIIRPYTFDLAVDPLEATDSVAYGRYNALSVIAAGPKGSLLSAPDTYMDKLAVGPRAKKVIKLGAPVKMNIQRTAKALGKSAKEVTVIVLDRERHKDLINQIRKAGARVRLITDGDVAGAIAPSMPGSGIDMLMGIGASAEAVLAATAINILGGQLFCRFAPQTERDRKLVKNAAAHFASKVFSVEDLAKGEQLTFTATGVIDGPLLRGVEIAEGFIITHSLVMRGQSGTIRYITTHHKMHKNPTNK